MKRFFAMLLLAAMVLSLAACGSDEALAAKQAELDQLKGQMATKTEENERLQAEVTQLQSQLDAIQGESVIHKVYTVHATVDGKTAVDFTGERSFVATADLSEGYVVDHWELNGEAQPDSAKETFTFNADADALVVAVIRAEKKLTTINAEFRFLDKGGSPAGEKYTEFVFEKDYVNPVTNETCAGGEISAEITAVIPNGKMVDYWLINGVPYHYQANVNSFIVDHLDEATTYEVVFKDIPITYYSVTCDGCKYDCTEGNYDGKSSGYVAAGTTITLYGGKDSGYFWINGVKDTQMRRYITITITQDTYIEFHAVIN